METKQTWQTCEWEETVFRYTNICCSVVWDRNGKKRCNAIGSSRTLQLSDSRDPGLLMA